MKYAIGEILLVTIGILIALSVNTWNTSRQNLATEIEILEELKKGLIQDKTVLEGALKNYRRDSIHLHRLDSLLKFPNQEYSEDLNTLFGKVYGIRFNRLNSAFYEDLKSAGLQIIQNKDLRLRIVNLFETNYKILQGHLDNEQNINQVTRPYYLANFTEINFQESANPIDYKKIWTDPYFKNIVHYRIITLNLNQLQEYNKAINTMNDLIGEIDSYLLSK
ncbi:DUF6090 family protein [Algoriphagus namhaensis]|uniref:DUF6090 family protein n=1 Tax=Algoriphagus namhaensis TaxID=915353 RepID=A0ABV8ANJ2_9BACT